MSHFIYWYAECRYAKCHYAECHRAECHRYVQCHWAECRYAECHYAECHYAECRYAECCGAILFKSEAKIGTPTKQITTVHIMTNRRPLWKSKN